MLKIIIGTDWKKNRNALLELLSRDVALNRDNRILLVPESISHDTERRLCAAAGDKASRFAEVLSFPRLVNRVSDATGHGACQCMDNGGRIVAMASATIQLHSKLKAYAAVETKPEFLSDLVDAVDEFKRCCIQSHDLMAASKQSESDFAQKLEELALILDAYDGICSHGKRDPRDQMLWLLQQLQDSDFAQKHTFYVDGFPDFTRQHMAILEHCITNSPMVVVSMNCDAPETDDPAFVTAGRTTAHLINFAKRNGIPVDICKIDADNNTLHTVARKLFRGKVETLPETNQCLSTLVCDTINSECDEVAERILRIVQNGGRYRDICVATTDMNAYRGAIRMAFSRRGIPVYLSGTDDILDMPVISGVFAALDAAIGGFERKDVLRFMKSALSPLSLDISDRLENYAVSWNITGRRWLEDWTLHPEGLGQSFDDNQQKMLDNLNEARILLMNPLESLRLELEKSTNICQQIYALYNFMQAIRMPQKLESLAQQMDIEGKNRDAQIMRQLWEILVNALEQVHDTIGNSTWRPDAFTRLLRLLLSRYDVGTIPTVLDAVMIGPISAVSYQQAEHLFIVGAQEGSFPGYSGSVGVLNDQERDALRKLGVPIIGGSIEGLDAEFAQIFSTFCCAETSVTVSCPSAQRSYIFKRLAVLSGQEITITNNGTLTYSNSSESAALLARGGQNDAATLLGLEREYSILQKKANHTMGNVQPENIKGLYGDTLNLSASQVDRLAECRLSYFLNYGLRAKERKTITVDPAEFGTYVHDVLENTGRHIKELGGFRKVSLEQTLQIANQYAQAYAEKLLGQLDTERMAYLFNRNARELEIVVTELWNELQTSKFDPIGFEVSFGKNGELDPIVIDGTNMKARLRGYVDRVDVWKEGSDRFFRVVDYKTGKKDFDYCDVFNGLGLQMLLYMFALEDKGECVIGTDVLSAGVQYFPARAPLISVDGVLSDEEADTARNKAWKRNGLLLAQKRVLEAMELDAEFSRLCSSLNKDGSVGGDVATRQQLVLLKEYVFLLLARMVDDIASGFVAPNPYTRGSSHNACTYCPYACICHPDEVADRRNYKAMSAGKFWEEIGKEMGRNG